MQLARATGGGGVRLSVRTAGPEDAPAILFLHGWCQHSLAFSRQLGGALAERFRLAAPDLRGHGASDRPEDAGAYRDGRLWADDVAGVIAALGLRRPVLVGWSMGGWVAFDYLRHHGDAGIAGLVLIGSSARSRAMPGPSPAGGQGRGDDLLSTDHGRALEATIAFVRACTAAPLSKHDLAFIVGFNALVPSHVRAACRARDEDWRPDLARLARPALVIQGAADRLCPEDAVAEVVEALPEVRRLDYKGCGHMPFWEAAQRFDADLAAFAGDAAGREAA
jgi:pimeloyl-ACP methyl ester carboxylesterase